MSKLNVFIIAVFLFMLPSLALAAPALEVASFSYDPAPASPSTTMNVWIQVRNSSNEAANNAFIRLALDDPSTGRPNYPFSAPDQNLEQRFSLAPYQSSLIRYSISVDAQALNGDYEISISLGDGTTGTILRKTPQTITILARNPKIEIIEAPKVEKRPGSQFDLPITIKNLGNATAYNVLIGVEEDRTVTSTGTVVERPINSVGNSLQYIEKLAPNETALVQLHLSVDNTAEVKTYSVPITIKWQDSNKNDSTTSRTVGIRVIKEPSIDVSLGDIKASVTNKGAQEINIDIFNKGAGIAKNVTVEVKGDNVTMLSASKVFIGTLESDDFDTFKSLMKVPAGQDVDLDLVVTYTNANDDELSIEKKITIGSSLIQADETNGGPDLVTIVILLAVLAFVGNWGYQKFLKKKE